MYHGCFAARDTYIHVTLDPSGAKPAGFSLGDAPSLSKFFDFLIIIIWNSYIYSIHEMDAICTSDAIFNQFVKIYSGIT